MLKQLNKKSEGFTIIEVLIVLAIAGLILLVVFLAVPALQRNSRNTQRKSDVARVGGAIQEFSNNNNGKIPVAADSTTIQSQLGTLAYYVNTNVTVVGPAPAGPTTGTSVDTVQIYTGAVCTALAAGTPGQGATSTGATIRQIAIVYQTEAGSGVNNVCTGS
ncbi:MAG: hypothetical protein NVSMB46_00950 [Candidatus Saccharimonadales bacterium]